MPKTKSKGSLKEIYTLIVESLKTTTPKITKDIKYYRTVDYHKWKDNDFLETMALVIFSSTLDWDIVKSKWKAIKAARARGRRGKIERQGWKILLHT